MARYISVDVELTEVIASLSDEDIKLIAKELPEGEDHEAALEAIQALRACRYADALTTMERHFLPRWRSVDMCRLAYANAMAGKP